MASNQNETWLSGAQSQHQSPAGLSQIVFDLRKSSKTAGLSQVVFDVSKSSQVETAAEPALQSPVFECSVDSRKERGITHEEVKARERWGQVVVVYAPRLEFVSALCMFCRFCRFCRFLHRRPTVRLAHMLVYLALVLVDLCTSITTRQKKNLFTHFCNQAALLSFFVAFSSFG